MLNPPADEYEAGALGGGEGPPLRPTPPEAEPRLLGVPEDGEELARKVGNGMAREMSSLGFWIAEMSGEEALFDECEVLGLRILLATRRLVS